jgi:pimeloyl-ACP methyl ester carboxylesterase
MDALKIQKATIGGFDWGARSADIVAALWPERCKALVSVSGYLIGSREAGKAPLPPKAELQWWYQYYFATDRGREGYDKYRRDFSKLIWQLASPKWNFDDATFARSAESLDNPDHVAIVIHNYRWRLGLAEGEAKYDDLEKQLAAAPVACTHTAAMAVLAKVDVAFATEQRIAAFGSAAARLLKAYAMQIEVLRRLRHGGQQVVRVEHVHVNDGGQAVIGNVKNDTAKV